MKLKAILYNQRALKDIKKTLLDKYYKFYYIQKQKGDDFEYK